MKNVFLKKSLYYTGKQESHDPGIKSFCQNQQFSYKPAIGN